MVKSDAIIKLELKVGSSVRLLFSCIESPPILVKLGKLGNVLSPIFLMVKVPPIESKLFISEIEDSKGFVSYRRREVILVTSVGNNALVKTSLLLTNI